MFDNVRARYALRIAIVATLTGLGALRASITDGLDAAEIIDVIEVTLAAGATYAGLGAASRSVEPSIGRK
jgi:hypothetical protein